MINYVEKYHSFLYCILGLIGFGVYLFQRIDGLSLKVGNAVPVLLVPFVIVIACFLREWTGFWFGLVCGIALDTTANGTAIFHTLVLMLLGVSAGLIFRFYMNRNIKSAIIVGAAGSAIFFLLKWFFLDFLSGDPSAGQLLVGYHFPSAIYTAIFTIPFFYLVRFLSKRHLMHQDHN